MLRPSWEGARGGVEADEVHHSRDQESRVHGGVLPVLDVALLKMSRGRVVHPPAGQSKPVIERMRPTILISGMLPILKVAQLQTPRNRVVHPPAASLMG